jgi:hypothetical protein
MGFLPAGWTGPLRLPAAQPGVAHSQTSHWQVLLRGGLAAWEAEDLGLWSVALGLGCVIVSSIVTTGCCLVMLVQ